MSISDGGFHICYTSILRYLGVEKPISLLLFWSLPSKRDWSPPSSCTSLRKSASFIASSSSPAFSFSDFSGSPTSPGTIRFTANVDQRFSYRFHHLLDPARARDR